MRPRLLVVAMAGVAAAVSLADIEPAPTTLSSTCANTYNSDIDGCTTADFAGSCSDSCTAALNTLSDALNKKDCSKSTDLVVETTLLGQIYAGHVLQKICDSPLASKTQSAPSTEASAGVASTTATASATSANASDASSSTSPASQTQSRTSSTAAPSSAAKSSSSSSAPLPASTKLTMQQNQYAAISSSGGGSPFDLQLGSSASRTSAGLRGLLCVVGFAVFAG
jgi:hypothetical protein